MFVDVLTFFATALSAVAICLSVRAMYFAWRGDSRAVIELDQLDYESRSQSAFSAAGGLVAISATTSGSARWLAGTLESIDACILLACIASGIHLMISSMRRMDEIVARARKIRAERERRAYAAALAALVRAQDAKRYGSTGACDAAVEAAANTDDGGTEAAIAAALADPANQPAVDFYTWLADRGLTTPSSPPIEEVQTAPTAPTPDAA